MAIISKVYIEMHSGKQTQTDTTTEESEVWLHLHLLFTVKMFCFKKFLQGYEERF